MCGFTRMNDTLGDDEALAVLAEFRAIVRGLSPDHGIRVGKWLGDGCMFVGTEVRPVVETVLDLTERMENASIVLPLRIGIAAGKVIVFEGDDFIGMAINLASRLCDAAGPGEILANDEVVAALGDGFPVVPARRAARSPASSPRSRCGGWRAPPRSRTTYRSASRSERAAMSRLLRRARRWPAARQRARLGRDQERRAPSRWRRRCSRPASPRCATSIPSPIST